MVQILDAYLPEAAASEPSTSTTKTAWRAYQGNTTSAGDTEEQIVQNHLRLVRSVVDRMKASLPSHIEVDDLYSVGVTGLIHAVRKFDPAQGTPFASFASMRIRGAVLDELRRMDWMSRSSRSKAKRLTDVIAELEQRLGREATEIEVAQELSMTAEEYAELLDEVRPICHVELDGTYAEDDDESSLHDIIADETQQNASDLLQRKELIQMVIGRLERMPDMQKKVLAMYYFENLRLAEIAAVFGVTESRICQIHSQAVLGLRTYIKSAMER